MMLCTTLLTLSGSSEAEAGDPGDSIGKLFRDPQLFTKIATNPKTKHLVSDVGFMNQVREMRHVEDNDETHAIHSYG